MRQAEAITRRVVLAALLIVAGAAIVAATRSPAGRCIPPAQLLQFVAAHRPTLHERAAELTVASWDRPGHEVDDWLAEQVDAEVLNAATAGLTFACAQLGVPTPAWSFYLSEGRENRKYRQKYGRADWPSFRAPQQNGHADPRRQNHRHTCRHTAWLACEVAAHEVAHVAQPGRDRDADEEAATKFGVWATYILVLQGKVATVHLHDGFPYSGVTLTGLVDTEDVLVDTSSGTVFRNFGLPSSPRWVRHHATCPVEPVRRAA